jgi:hypothetical protein
MLSNSDSQNQKHKPDTPSPERKGSVYIPAGYQCYKNQKDQKKTDYGHEENNPEPG